MSDAKFWDRAATKYAKSKISDMDAYHETLERMRFHLRPDAHVLEIGCGTGSTALELAGHVTSYVGTDISSGMIEIANGKITDGPANLSFMVSTASDIPNGPFDAVIALNLLHVVPDFTAVLRAIYDALPSGGLFIAKTSMLKDGPWIIPKVIPLMRMIGKAPNVQIMSDVELRAALSDTGFDLIETLTQKDIAPRLFTVARKP